MYSKHATVIHGYILNYSNTVTVLQLQVSFAIKVTPISHNNVCHVNHSSHMDMKGH